LLKRACKHFQVAAAAAVAVAVAVAGSSNHIVKRLMPSLLFLRMER
jgi:hypothetical protein